MTNLLIGLVLFLGSIGPGPLAPKEKKKLLDVVKTADGSKKCFETKHYVQVYVGKGVLCPDQEWVEFTVENFLRRLGISPYYIRNIKLVLAPGLLNCSNTAEPLSAWGCSWPGTSLVDSSLPKFQVARVISHELGHQILYHIVGNGDPGHIAERFWYVCEAPGGRLMFSIDDMAQAIMMLERL